VLYPQSNVFPNWQCQQTAAHSIHEVACQIHRLESQYCHLKSASAEVVRRSKTSLWTAGEYRRLGLAY
jgi:hypothetical protein